MLVLLFPKENLMNQFCFISAGINVIITIMVPNMELSMQKEIVDALQSLLKVKRENCYNDSGKFKCIYIFGSSFHNNFPPTSEEAW